MTREDVRYDDFSDQLTQTERTTYERRSKMLGEPSSGDYWIDWCCAWRIAQRTGTRFPTRSELEAARAAGLLGSGDQEFWCSEVDSDGGVQRRLQFSPDPKPSELVGIEGAIAPRAQLRLVLWR